MGHVPLSVRRYASPKLLRLPQFVAKTCSTAQIGALQEDDVF